MELNDPIGALLPMAMGRKRPRCVMGSRIGILSLNALAFKKAAACNFSVVASSCLHAPSRQSRLLALIQRVAAPVMAFQDVDAFDHWWSPALKPLGYDLIRSARDDDSSLG
jgi:mRNA deadenylase 3'-5' endonuclease subunit Ccr4